MTDSDVQIAAKAMQAGLENRPDGDKENWTNPQTGRQGAIIPVATYVSDNGYFCRRYKEEMALTGGRYGVSFNEACRNDDGIWVWHHG
jgi:surface antigen